MKKRLEELTQEQAGDIRNLHQELIGTQGAQQPERYSPCSQKTRTELETVSMAQLYDMTLTPRTPVVEGLVLPGTYLFVGSPKTGKSFFTAQLGYHVATGTPLWDYPVRQGEVLCLALEDDYSRLQNRLNQMFGVEAIDGFHFAIRSRTLAEGLVDQMEDFIRKHPSTRLIIVDTLQKVREAGNESYSYSMDYQNITALKAFSDSHNVAVLVVHHTRKMEIFKETVIGMRDPERSRDRDLIR